MVLAWNARTYRRTWRATVTISFLNPIFFLLSVGVLLGDLVDRRGADLGGLSYLEFVAPGLLAATAMQLGAGEGAFPVMAGLRWVRSYHAIAATPVRVPELLAGVLAWACLRLAVGTVVFAAVAAAFGAFTSPLAALAPAAAVLCGLAFAAPLAAVSASVDSSLALTGIFRFVLLPMFLLSGTFFPLERLPGWLEPVAWATPLWHGVALCRSLAAGDVDAAAALVHVGYLLALLALGAVLATRALERRLRQ
ncbi:MAG: ABC transporter permease [Thermoleophilia bacterium]|nr:ABC transporter permease [Thermoleophilia bacterium]